MLSLLLERDTMLFRKVGPIVVLAVSIGCGINSGCQRQSVSRVEDGETQKKGQAIAVRTVSVTETEVERATVQPATIHAFYKVEVRPRVTGYVEQINVDIGDVVQAGDVLATIDVPELQKQKGVLEARTTRFRSVEQQAKAGIELAKADVVAAQARLAQSRSELSRAAASLAASEAEFARTEDLVNRQSVESRLLDESRKRRDSELANREATQSAITSAEADVRVAEAKLTAAEADFASAQAETQIALKQTEELEVKIEFAEIRAAFDGVVTARSVDPGTLVYAGEASGNNTPSFVLSKIDRLRVHVAVPEVQAVSVRPGNEITLEFPFFANEQKRTAKVTRIANSLDASTRTMLVEAEIDNPDGKLLPGMFGQASIQTSSKVAVQTLPSRAVRFDESGNPYVYVIDDSDSVSIVNITTGFDAGAEIEVTSGLQPQQQVIDAHLRRFTAGQRVAILPN